MLAAYSPLQPRDVWARPDPGPEKALADKSEHAGAKTRLAHISGAVSLEEIAQSGPRPFSRDQCTFRHF